jgi:hypothetical protein
MPAFIASGTRSHDLSKHRVHPTFIGGQVAAYGS